MYKKFALFGICMIFIIACNQNNTKDNHSEHETPESNESSNPHEGHSYDEHSQQIELNDGKKWEVNKEMMVIIAQMESDVSSFAGKDMNDFQALSEKLSKNIDALTASCTMEGKSHEELHKWLLPFIDTVNKLSESKTKEESQNILIEINLSFTSFHNYFQ